MAAMATALTLSMTGNAAESAAVFGITLQEPLAMPQCSHDVADGKSFYLPPQAGACYELAAGAAAAGVAAADEAGVNKVPADGSVVIVWAAARKPEIVAGRGAMAVMADGKLQSVVFETGGMRSQNEVYQALVDQFGLATSTRVIPLEQGATVMPILAKWTLDRVDVLFYSAVEGPDKGVVSISAHAPAQLSSSAPATSSPAS
jgi:hypothetical protein